MAASDKLLGGAMLSVASFVFIYYTIWALFLPFLPTSSPLQPLFPPRDWAIRLPILLLLTAGIGISLFFGRVMLAEARKKKRQAGKAA